MPIGNVEFKGKVFLAPMAGVADRAFRELCVSYGASYCVGEMVSAKGVSMNDKKSKELMRLSDNERPAAIQIFGNSPETMAEAATAAMEFNPEIIDINMGCPAPKIIRSGAGSALMRSPDTIGKIVEAVVKSVNIPVTVKIRKGWDSESVNAVEVAKTAQSAGAAAVTVHGRTKQQMYAPSVDRDIIRQVKCALKIPVIGNGDITDGVSAKRMFDETCCDYIMLGRGALGRPWIFGQINEFLNTGVFPPEPDTREKMEVMLRHVETICLYRSERLGMNEARKHAIWYTKGIRGSASFRRELSTVQSISELSSIAEKIINISEEN